MKILAVTDSYPPHHTGGYQLRCRDVLEGLKKRGHLFKVITSRCPSKNCNQHIAESDIIRFLVNRSKIPSTLSRIINDIHEIRYINRFVKKFHPDLVYLSHLGDLAKPIFFYFSKLDYPMVFDDGGLGMVYINRVFTQGLYFTNNDNDSVLKKRLKLLINKLISLLSGGMIPDKLIWPANISIYFNNLHSKEFAQRNGAPVEQAKVIYSGVDTSLFYFKSRDHVCAPVSILVPGRIESQKGTKDAIAVLSILKEMNVKASLTVVGHVGSQEYLDEMNNEIQQLGLQNDIRILPMLSHMDLAELYREFDICLFPSYHKSGLSRVPLEAMATGCLVISYGNEASSEIINNAKTGYILPEGAVHDVAEVIRSIINNPYLYHKITSNARDVILSKYSKAAYIDQLEEYFTCASQKS